MHDDKHVRRDAHGKAGGTQSLDFFGPVHVEDLRKVVHDGQAPPIHLNVSSNDVI